VVDRQNNTIEELRLHIIEKVDYIRLVEAKQNKWIKLFEKSETENVYKFSDLSKKSIEVEKNLALQLKQMRLYLDLVKKDIKDTMDKKLSPSNTPRNIEKSPTQTRENEGGFSGSDFGASKRIGQNFIRRNTLIP